MGEVEGVEVEETLELKRLRLDARLIDCVAIGQVTYLWASVSSSMKWGSEHCEGCPRGTWSIGYIVIAQLIISPSTHSFHLHRKHKTIMNICHKCAPLLGLSSPFLSALQVSALECFQSFLRHPPPPIFQLTEWACEVVYTCTCSYSVVCHLPSNSTAGLGLTKRSFVENKFWHLPSIGKPITGHAVGSRAMSHWEKTGLMLKQNLYMGP